jgi:hypothetical protein
MGWYSYLMLEAEIEVQGEVHRGSDRWTSTQERQHTASQQHLLGLKVNLSPIWWTNSVELTHFFLTPPIFFMNIIISELFKFPCVSVPIVSCILPNTWAIEAETKFPRLFETELATWSILVSRFRALVIALLKSLRKSTI